MKNLFHNWKTSLLGTGCLTAAVTYFINNPNDWKTAAGIAVTGILGLVASDGKTPPLNDQK